MFSKIRIALGFVLLLSVIFVAPAFAGGWAVITLDEFPADVVAGEPLTVGFMVLQHGKTPMTDLTPTVTAILSKGEQFTVNAEPEGKSGHYTATLVFPKEGNWSWSIQAFTMDQPMPNLSVTAPIAKVTDQPVPVNEPVSAPIPTLSIIRVVVFGVGLVGLAYAFQRKSRMAIMLTVLCLLVGVMTFVTEPTIPVAEAQSKSSPKVANSTSISQVELGEQLFVAKGCVTCHINSKVSKSLDYQNISGGAPNLTNFSASPEALRMRLKDPSSVKSDTWMPNLNLSDDEIEALIAFINSE